MTEAELTAAVDAILVAAEDQIRQESAALLRGDLAELLPQLDALIVRAESVAALRAAKGRRGLSEANREMLGRLFEQLQRLRGLIESGVLG